MSLYIYSPSYENAWGMSSFSTIYSHLCVVLKLFFGRKIIDIFSLFDLSVMHNVNYRIGILVITGDAPGIQFISGIRCIRPYHVHAYHSTW